jgi:lipase chaperone LimK
MKRGCRIAAMLLGICGIFIAMNMESPWQKEVSHSFVSYLRVDGGETKSPSILPQSMPQGERFDSGLENLPASLADTDIPGNFTTDAAGNLMVDLSLRHYFDYFLSAQGEETLPVLVARMRAHLRHRLPPSAAEQGSKVLDQYLAYLQALAAVEDVGGGDVSDVSPALIRSRKALERSLRSQHLSADVSSAFFLPEDQFDDYVLSAMELERDTGLNEQERQRRVSLLLERVPSDLRKQLVTAAQEEQALQQSRRLQLSVSPQNEEALRRLRVQQWGEDAAQRLAAVDQSRADWRHRTEHYLSLREEIVRNTGLAEPERRHLIDQLRNESFSSSETRRVMTYELLYDNGQLAALRPREQR